MIERCNNYNLNKTTYKISGKRLQGFMLTTKMRDESNCILYLPGYAYTFHVPRSKCDACFSKKWYHGWIHKNTLPKNTHSKIPYLKQTYHCDINKICTYSKTSNSTHFEAIYRQYLNFEIHYYSFFSYLIYKNGSSSLKK